MVPSLVSGHTKYSIQQCLNSMLLITLFQFCNPIYVNVSYLPEDCKNKKICIGRSYRPYQILWDLEVNHSQPRNHYYERLLDVLGSWDAPVLNLVRGELDTV